MQPGDRAGPDSKVDVLRLLHVRSMRLFGVERNAKFPSCMRMQRVSLAYHLGSEKFEMPRFPCSHVSVLSLLSLLIVDLGGYLDGRRRMIFS